MTTNDQPSEQQAPDPNNPESQNDPVQPTAAAPPRLSVVGIGASAGGLRTLQTFFRALPADTGMSFVVVVHLSPEHKSVLAELLQPHTEMPVSQVEGRVEMQPDQVYVIPPGKRLLVTEGHLELAEFEMPRGQRLQIDAFFRSLAEHHGDGVAIILSGAGSDGAVGIQSIKEGGGLIFVQDPVEAEYDGMPKSAIATGLADVVAPLAELAAQLVAAKRTRAALQLPVDPTALSEPAEQTLSEILAQLRMRTGHDFSGYKRSTVLRRIGRRMQLPHLETLTAYLHRLRQDGDEVDALYRDLLIHVTGFFRDPAAWRALAEQVIPALFAGKGRDDTVRVWAVGCASGEEVYGLAMLLLEHAATLDNAPALQIFASDPGRTALDVARQGVYPEAIAANVSEERLARFFQKDNNHYRVRDQLRELILFTPHNLLQDPPFSKLDLILCRNLLIYLQRGLQERVFETFYYALRPDGYLFLGSAETVEGVTDLFDTVDKLHRIYRRSPQSRDGLILPALPLRMQHRELSSPHEQSSAQSERTERQMHGRLLEEAGPPSVLVDDAFNLLHLSETAGHFLKPVGGYFFRDVTRLVRPELESALRTALTRALASGQAVRTRSVPVGFNGGQRPVSLLVHPNPARGRALVMFLYETEPAAGEAVAQTAAGGDDESTGATQELEAELRVAQQRIQSMREEYETTVEELRAANEELQSTNEEYRSTLEELETSKEELQSMNEELQTVNHELKSKVEETSCANSDLQNLFAATEIATLFLDRKLRVKRYTPRAAELFNLMPPDRGRPIGHLRTTLDYEQLEADAHTVLDELTVIERDIQSEDGRWFQVNVRPYRTVEDKIEGVVITFVDITTNKEHELALRDAKEYAESIVYTIPDALLILDTDLRVQTANNSFYETFQVRPEATEGVPVYGLGNGQWDIPELRTLLEDILPENKVFTGYEVEHEFEVIGRRVMLLNGRRLDHVQLILLAITDITEHKQAEEALYESEARFRALVTSSSEVLYRMSPDWREMRQLRSQGFLQNTEKPSQSWLDAYIHPDDQPYVSAVIKDAISTKSIFELEHRIRRADGSWGWTFSRAVPLVDAEGEIVEWFGAANDITKRKRAEEALRQREERYRTLYESIDEGFVVIQMIYDESGEPVDWRFLEVNPAFEKQTGLQDVVGRTALELVPGLEAEWIEAYGRIAATGEPQRFTQEVRELGRWYEVYAFRMGDPEDRRVAVLSSDVTARKRAEEALHQNERRLRLAFEAANMGAWMVEEDAEAGTIDAHMRQLFDLPADAAVMSLDHFYAVMHPDDREQVAAAIQAAWTQTTDFHVEFRVRVRGEERWYAGRGRVFYRDDEPHYLLSVNYDITERKRTDQALRQLTAELEARVEERTQQVRNLAANLTMAEQAERRRISQILHDVLQQHLYGLQFQTMFLREALDSVSTAAAGEEASGAEAQRELDKLDEGLVQAIQMTRNLSVDLSPPVLEGDGLGEAVRWLAAHMQEQHGLTVEVQVADDFPVPDADLRVLLFQIVRELLFNIVKHAGVSDATASLTRSDDHLQIEVVDHGGGFDVDEVLGDPRRSHGLLRNQRRLEVIGGQMQIESIPQDGTRVVITCPLRNGHG